MEPHNKTVVWLFFTSIDNPRGEPLAKNVSLGLRIAWIVQGMLRLSVEYADWAWIEHRV